MVDHPLPWPSDAVDLEAMAPLRPHLQHLAREGRPHRVQLAASGGASEVRVALHRRPVGLFARYERTEVCVAPDEVGAACIELLSAEAPAVATGPRGVEVLICTHGRRDVCCGSAGTALHQHMAELGVPDGVSLRRTSHTGGHRFAPTALLLPTGTAWAWLEPRTLEGILSQALPAERAADLYRGCMGIDGAEAQVVDAALLRRVGWSWLDTPRTATVTEQADGCREVLVEHVRDDGSIGRIRATVGHAGSTPVLRCGEPADGSEKAQDHWAVLDLVDVAPADGRARTG